jgi:hypothetical protein
LPWHLSNTRCVPKEITVSVGDDVFDEAVSRLRAAGIESPEDLLEAAVQASAVDRLETIGGFGAVPTALSDVRSAWLFELCRLRNEILPDEVVAVLFRIMPTTAGSVIRRMQGTYEAALHESLSAHMVAMAKLSSPRKETGEAPLHKVTFATPAAFSHALKLIAAAGLSREVSTSPSARSVEFSQQIEVEGPGGKNKIAIAKDVLGIR